MNKLMCYTLLFLLLLSSVTAVVEVQLSLDNVSFYDIQSTGQGGIDLNTSFAFVENLQPSIEYFFHASNN